MNKTVKIILGIIFVIILFGVACFGAFRVTNKNNENNIVENQTTNQIDTNTVNNTTDENTVDEENTIQNNIVENTVKNNKTETKEQEAVPPAVQNSIYETNSDAATTDRQQQAIELVKKDWGEDSTVTFTCDHVTPQGEFVIAVISTETASVKSYFIVNLEKQTVMVDY